MEGVPQPERITSAAIKFNGEIVRGLSHGLAVLELEKIHPNWKTISHDPVEEGFLTSSGRFVDRKEAAEIADRAEQTSEESVAGRSIPDELDSSELSGQTLH